MKHSGFTLIEMAIVILVAGMVISLLSSMSSKFLLSSKIKEARAVVEKIDFSIEGCMAAFGRCPCPDTDGDGLENRNDGGTPADPGDDTCSAYRGTLPYRTLGLPGGDDVWGTPIQYAVFPACIRTTTLSICAALTTCITALTPCDVTKLRTTAAGLSTNQAYSVISCGPDKILNGLNSGGTLEYESPDKTMDASYDDLVKAKSFVTLYGRHCAGH